MQAKTYFVSVAMLVLSLGAYDVTEAAGPTLIKQCQTITQPGSYLLSANLTAAGDCLVVAADSVAIDLDGFTITGDGTGSGIGTDQITRTGIAIRDGTITNFEFGIGFGSFGVQVLVERMHITNNLNVGVAANEMTIIKDSLFFQNGDGINIGSRSVVTGNTSNRNTGSGIAVGVGSTVIGNTAGLNDNNGLVVKNGSTIVNNTTQGNDNFGLAITCPSNLIGNTSTINGTNLLLQGAGCKSVNNLAP